MASASPDGRPLPQPDDVQSAAAGAGGARTPTDYRPVVVANPDDVARNGVVPAKDEFVLMVDPEGLAEARRSARSTRCHGCRHGSWWARHPPVLFAAGLCRSAYPEVGLARVARSTICSINALFALA